MNPGDKARVLRGVYENDVVTVKRINDEVAICELGEGDDSYETEVEVADLGSTELGDEDIRRIEREVVSAAEYNAPQAYRRTMWLAERVREPVEDRDLPALERELVTISAEMEEASRPFVADALEKFRAAFAAIPSADRAAWWNQHRATWTRHNRVFRDYLTEQFGHDPTSAEFDAWIAPIRALQDRIEQSRHAAFANDLEGTAPIATNSALEAAIDAAPDDDATWLVYADWLQTHGDPRGELAVEGSTAHVIVARHERYLLGGLPRYPEVVEYRWRRGFLRSAKVMTKRAHEDAGIEQASLVKTLMALHSSRFLEELRLGAASIHEEGVAEAVLDALISGGGRPTLRRLAFETDREEEMLSWTETGLLGRVWPLYPNLTEIDICAGVVSLGALDLPALANLRVETCYLTADDLEALRVSKLPGLRTLELWFGEGNVLDATMALVESPLLAQVPALGLVNTTFTDELAEALARSPRLASLELLDLSRGTLGDDGALAIARACAEGRAPRLRTIDVHDCYLTNDGIAALRATGLAIRDGEQRTVDGEGERRYCAVWE